MSFLDRPEATQTLCQGGLRMTLAGREYTFQPVECFSSPGEALGAGRYDAALLAVKSYDTAGVLEALAPHQGKLLPLLCLQNGVDNEPLLASGLGEERVIAGTVTSSISRSGPGAIIVERSRGVGIAAGYSISERIAEAFQAGGMRVRLYQNALAMKWSKMLTNLPVNASPAILDMTPSEVLAHPGLFRLEMAMMREALQVMAALSLQVVDLPGVPVRMLAFVFANLPAGLARPILSRALGAGRGGKMPSFHIDLHGGRKQSEVGWLNGAVVRWGEETGVKTPVNRALTKTLMELTEGRERIEDYSGRPERLLAAAGMTR